MITNSDDLPKILDFVRELRELGARTVTVGDVSVEFSGAHFAQLPAPGAPETESSPSAPTKEQTAEDLLYWSSEEGD